MSLRFRRARPEDAHEVGAVAEALSHKRRRSAGIGEEALSREGFLLYPLNAVHDNAPNYRERIVASEHFWVAEDGGHIVAFMMAYTFDCLDSLAHKTDNDRSTLDHFVARMGARGSVIYLAQVAVLPPYQRQGVMPELVEHALAGVDGTVNPAIVGEIAQSPLWNEKSTRAFARAGFSPVFLREKDSPESSDRRLSSTFIRSIPCQTAITVPVRE